MREIRLYGSEGGVPRKRGIPTPIRRQGVIRNDAQMRQVQIPNAMKRKRLTERLGSGIMYRNTYILEDLAAVAESRGGEA